MDNSLLNHYPAAYRAAAIQKDGMVRTSVIGGAMHTAGASDSRCSRCTTGVNTTDTFLGFHRGRDKVGGQLRKHPFVLMDQKVNRH